MISSLITKSKKNILGTFPFLRNKVVSLILALFVFSLLSWLICLPRYQRMVFLFPGVVNSAVQGETRLVPRVYGRENRIRTAVDEILLGPISVERSPLFPPESRLRSLLYRHGKVYIDFDASIFLDNENLVLNFEKALDVFRESLLLNFPYIKLIQITVNGQIPFEFPFIIE